jgi:D-alanyl-D-alanine carboxypeptidase
MQKKQNNSLYTFSVTLISLSAVLLTLAAASARKQIEQKPAAPAALRAGVRGDFAGLVDIGGARKMYLECRGTGSPTVVLVSGKGNRADIWNTPNPEKPGPVVFTEVARLTRVCAYDRPGTTGALASEPSRSDPVPEPVTVADAVVDLHALLIASKEPGPFVLVGHSIGGLISRLYASTYPRDVSGLVLIDALSEDLYKRLTPEQQAVFEKLNDVPERYDNVRSFEQVRAAPPVRAMPIVVLTADHSPITSKDIASGRFPPGVTAKFADALWAAQVPAQDSLARLFPNAKHITNTNSSHYIQIDQPQLVIDSIREVVDAVRNSGASPRNETGNELPPIAESSRIALEKALDEAFSKSGLPGVITGLWIPGTGSWIASRGVSDLKTKAPMTADLQAPIGSVTKSFAITIALQLVGEGRLRLEDTIERWYPQIPDASAITIKMLLNHSSGFPDISMLQLDLRCANPKRVVSPDELIAMGIKLPRAKFAPGKSSLYSSLNTIVLGRILEKITGQSFATLLSERLLNPLALHRTKLDTDGKLDPPFCHGYTDFCRNMPPHTDTSEWPQFSFASGALASTLLDLHRWGIALGEGFGLTPALRQTRIDEELGIGVQRERPGGRVISFGHAGSEAGYSANVQFYPCTGAVWALMANGDGGTGEIFMPVLKALQPIVEPLAVPSEKCAP